MASRRLSETDALQIAMHAISFAKSPLDCGPAKVAGAKQHIQSVLKLGPRMRSHLTDETVDALGIEQGYVELALNEIPLVRYHCPLTGDVVLCLPEVWMERFAK